MPSLLKSNEATPQTGRQSRKTRRPHIIAPEPAQSTVCDQTQRIRGLGRVLTSQQAHASAVSGRIEIVLMRGHRVIVDSGVDAAVLARVLAVLERP
jgi:hypothetical protein